MQNRESLLLICLVLFTACGKHTVEAEFQPYLDSFYQEAEKQGATLPKETVSIHFGDTQPGVAAHCVLSNSRPGLGGDEIVVNKTAWETYSNYYVDEREVVLFHELGHCLLGLDHQQETVSVCDETDHRRINWFRNAPISIMKSDAFVDPMLYEHLRSYYMSQLFHKEVFSLIRSPSRQIRSEVNESQCRFTGVVRPQEPPPTDNN